MKTKKAKPEKTAVSVTEDVRGMTLEDVNNALAEINANMEATPEDMSTFTDRVEAARLWQNVVARTEAAIESGGHSRDELGILNQQVAEAKARIARLAHDIEILPLRQKLDSERLRLEAVAARRAMYGTLGTAPAHIAIPETFGPAIGGFTLEENAPPELVALFARLQTSLAEIAVLVEKSFSELAGEAAEVASLDKPVTDEALAAVRRARRGLAMSLKLYLLTAANVFEELVATDTAAIVSAHNSALDEEAGRIAADIEAKAIKAGITPDLARQGAAENPEVAAVLARKVAGESMATFEYGFLEVLARKAESARKILEAELSALV